MIIFIHQKEKNTVITKITLTISNGEHIKHTLSTSKPYRHQFVYLKYNLFIPKMPNAVTSHLVIA